MIFNRWVILVLVGILLIPINMFVPNASAEIWENEYGKLEVWPDVSKGIITQVQYCNLTSYIDDAEIDVTFRFDIPVGNPDIWIWKNISHWVTVPTYGIIDDDYTLYGISGFELIDEPPYVDYGDIPSLFYASGFCNASNDTIYIGFDSFDWLNPEHTEATFYYEYHGQIGTEEVESFWFDWDNIKSLFSHIEYESKHYYYVHSWIVKDQLYQFKWSYDIPLGSSGKWDLMAKLSSDPLGTWRVSIDPWWDSDWDYYKTITVADKIDDYQMRINITKDGGGNVSCEGHCNDNFSDIRFVYDNITELPYWIEYMVSGDYSIMWVNNSGNYSSFEMFYGNSAVGSNSDGNTTFDFFDDFYNLNAWVDNSGGKIVASDSILTATEDSTWREIHHDLGSAQKIRMKTRVNYFNKVSYNLISVSVSANTIASWDYTPDPSTVTHAYSTTQLGASIVEDDGTGNSIIFTPAENVWYKYFSCYYDKHYLLSDMDSVLISDIGITGTFSNLRYIYIQCRDRSGGAVMKLDWLFICKYSLIEPSWSSFGSEQSKPDYSPVLVSEYPVNNSIDVTLFPVLGITITDLDLDNMNITWYSNVSGSWIVIGTNLTGVYDGTYYQKFDEFGIYGLTYYWNVSITDGSNTTDSGIFSFTAEDVPTDSSDYAVLGVLGIFGLLSYLAVKRKKRGD